MKHLTTYQGKKVLVLGLAKSGVNAARLLRKLGAQVTVSDVKPLAENQDAQELQNDGFTVITGEQTANLLDPGYDLVVKNPGIFYDVPVVKRALADKVPVISEMELASEVAEAELIAVTGSNGKTTTTTMIQKMVDHDRRAGKAVYAGNIGIPASQVAQAVTADDTLVLEVSSFMLVGTTTFHPHIAVLTNIFSNHLDYHKTRENYVAAKMKITANQTADDYFVVNFDSPELRELSEQSAAQVVPFSREAQSQAGAYELNGDLYFKDEKLMPASDIKVPGDHNVENALAAIAVAKIKGVSTEAIVAVLRSFGGVRHRTQYVLEADGRQYYNDSKATDMEATEMALKGFTAPVVLIAGGLDRGYTFEKLVPSLKAHVKAVVLVGQTAKLLEDAAKQAGIQTIRLSENVETAVPTAYELSDAGDIILLSPANASWDQYPNFEVRGDKFIKAVEQLTGKQEEK
ncbi:UDP-N-acetylmuramoyl-L-alanine--D-glutamate ligase [Levilactobacillus brevis]|uniref:UDP-N-acetylmuramoylalanine--D-glutamate ligase n=1 Tax=Levilactobacillus brevis TaxID=1580 RepID=A0AA41JU20_LEVBR|nr:UDP-N-acetylmuramoyl-L-alanine--D-glutamate ligase [Levilactobacillus brevis]KID41875.1 UDP-N-acetylmuramoylalanine--D-glutamate ligase [Levilactobacillus brevis]MBS0947912.1 UDP-N-acetylmuramoyl-L-alanine--D-glutamate ligase [Levilactobacillus brevis]MBS0977293.1 UDP-N-acetylmuramoyl-L-alanine--D-glutamate ligase [Levilactobacillus brevis]MBS1011046.1 UDP-N-acetylmuramoyl-L-alanine--D-glutamate ligase [Levilactobacillus brevis]ODP93230.1 UDP-N-acetylmuramoyl-L-alanine--D-glutamate ligase [